MRSCVRVSGDRGEAGASPLRQAAQLPGRSLRRRISGRPRCKFDNPSRKARTACPGLSLFQLAALATSISALGRHVLRTCAPARGWTERPIKSTPFYPAAAHPCEHTLVAGARWWLRRVQPMALMVRAVDRLSTSSDGFLSSIGWSCPNRHRWFAELARSSFYGCDRRISGTLG